MELSKMKLFLTSSIGGSYVENGSRYLCGLDNSNHFLNLLKGHWTINSKCLILSSDPEDIELNDSFKVMFEEAFKISDFSLSEIEVCDVRNMSSLEEMLYDYDVIIIAGGHVPIQNKFYNSINLKNLLKIYSGIIIGISAGTMNCADVVYAQPELEGEAYFLQDGTITKVCDTDKHFQITT